MLLLEASDQLLEYRQRIARTLLAADYEVEPQELGEYTPHLTLRLGVPLSGDMLQQAKATFMSQKIIFTGWFVLRLVADSPTREMHRVSPTS